MKPPKHIIVLLLAVISAFAASAQTQSRTTMDILTAPTMWKQPGHGKTYFYTTFTRTHITDGSQSPINGRDVYTTEYYLSDTPDTVFDRSKVGQVENGKYVVTPEPDNKTEFFEIISLDPYKITTFFDSQGKNVPDQTTANFYAYYEPTVEEPIFLVFTRGVGMVSDDMDYDKKLYKPTPQKFTFIPAYGASGFRFSFTHVEKVDGTWAKGVIAEETLNYFTTIDWDVVRWDLTSEQAQELFLRICSHKYIMLVERVWDSFYTDRMELVSYQIVLDERL